MEEKIPTAMGKILRPFGPQNDTGFTALTKLSPTFPRFTPHPSLLTPHYFRLSSFPLSPIQLPNWSALARQGDGPFVFPSAPLRYGQMVRPPGSYPARPRVDRGVDPYTPRASAGSPHSSPLTFSDFPLAPISYVNAVNINTGGLPSFSCSGLLSK